MRYVFIVNPHAGKISVEKKLREQVTRLFREDEYEFFVTTMPKEAVTLAKKAAMLYDKVTVFACGGDGTINEVAQGLSGYKNAILAPFACGTGNDFVKSFTNKELFQDLQALKNGRVEQIDAIACGEKISLNICSVGFDATVAKQVTKFKNLPFVTSFGAYLMSVIYSFLTKTKFYLKIAIDDRPPMKQNYLLAAVANGLCYGGGFTPSPNASLQDGYLDVVLAKEIKRSRIMGLISLYKKGRHIEDEEVVEKVKDFIVFTRCKKITIHSSKYTSMNFDGECVDGKRITLEVLPKHFSLLLPEGTDFVVKTGQE